MARSISRVPYYLELVINGLFIALYILRGSGRIPSFIDRLSLDFYISLATVLVPVMILITVVVNYLNSKGIDEFLRKYAFSIIVFVPLAISFGDQEFAFWLGSAHLLSSTLSLYDNDRDDKSQKRSFGNWDILKRIRLSGAQLVIFSFAGLILAGTFFLMLPFSVVENYTLSFWDALFMATSATCVTGLHTVAPSQVFTIFGQMVLLVLIQVGGLSIMTLYSSMGILLGRSMRMKERVLMQDLLDVNSLEDLLAMIVNIIKYTLIIEFWGAVILAMAFSYEGLEFGKAVYFGFFHSISAFCNAGFSLFDNNLESFGTKPFINITIAILITLGGLGFTVLKELTAIGTRNLTIKRLSLHSKTVLIVSASLTFGGAVFIFFADYLHGLDGYTLWGKMQIALFQSVTCRTAGYNSIPLTNLHAYTLFGMIILMFIGASPGSTGGGIKTSTAAILIQSIKAAFRGKRQVTLFDRSIPQSMVVKATAITILSICILCVFVLLLVKSEDNQSLLTILFEATSALGTVGLSLGITPFLTIAGKIYITILMFIGRVGPLTLVIALGEQSQQGDGSEYPSGKIMIG